MKVTGLVMLAHDVLAAPPVRGCKHTREASRLLERPHGRP